MADEVTRNRATAGPEERATSSSLPGATARGVWFPAPRARSTVRRELRASSLLLFAALALTTCTVIGGVTLVAGLWVASVAFDSSTFSVVSALCLAVCTSTVALEPARRFALRANLRSSKRGLSIEGDTLAFVADSGVRQELLSVTEPFGVTLVTTRPRDRLVMAVSSAAGIFYVGADFDDRQRLRYASLLSMASAIATDDAGLEALGSDGDPIDLSPSAIAALVETLVQRDATCLDRVLLSDARGAPLSVDAHAMRAGGARFELSSPLEWRGFVFQEALGDSVAVYQATWVKQGSAEIVLVALLPSLSPAGEMSVTGIPELDRAGARDLRLGQATPDLPPPAEHRVAVDRLFMLPLRGALDQAPRASQQPAHAVA